MVLKSNRKSVWDVSSFVEDRIEKYLKLNNIENFKPDIILDEKIKIINIISDERDYSRANPQKYTYKDNTREVEHWTDLYVKLLSDVYEEYGEEFVKVAFNNKNFGTDAPSFSDMEDNKFREYKKISENLYCETNNNTSKKLRNLREIFRQLNKVLAIWK